MGVFELKKRFLLRIFVVTLLLLVIPSVIDTANDILDSRDTTPGKLTKAEITELLEDNALESPFVLFDERPLITASICSG